MITTVIEPKRGSDLTDANATINPAASGASDFLLPATTLTAPRVLTLGTGGGPGTNYIVRISRFDLTANTYTVNNGGPGSGTLFTFPSGPANPTGASFYFNGANWVYLSNYVLDSGSLGGGLVPIASGGTGQTTAVAGLDALHGTIATIASAATTDLSTATGEYSIISGNATITALGTMAAGAFRRVVFTGTPILTHNATSLILPGAANIQCAAGDAATFTSLGSGNWRCTSFQQASITPGAGLFGSDTLIKLLNSAPALASALELIASFTSNTAGSETAKWQVMLAKLGTLVAALDIRPDQTFFPQGTNSKPSISFQGDAIANATGIFYSQLSSALIIAVNGVQQLISAGTSFTMQQDNAGIVMGSISQVKVGLVDTFNALLASNAGNEQLGFDGTLAQNSQVGFVDFPTMAGPPTNSPSRNDSGHRSVVVDNVDQKTITFLAQNSTLWRSEGCNAKLGAALTDANLSKDVSNGAEFVLPIGTLTASRTLTLAVTGSPITNQVIRVTRYDATANTYLVKDDAATTLLTFPVSVRAAADFKFNGTHFVLDRYWLMN